MVDNTIFNHLTYADDLVIYLIFFLFCAGFQQLFEVCSQKAPQTSTLIVMQWRVIIYHYIIVRSRKDHKLSFWTSLDRMWSLQCVMRLKQMTWLMIGTFVQANMAICKFNMCSVTVKTTLFKTYFTHMYAARLRRESSVICILSLICNLGMRLLLKVLWWGCASQSVLVYHLLCCIMQCHVQTYV